MISIETAVFGPSVIFTSKLDFKFTTLNGLFVDLTIKVTLWILVSVRRQPV